MQLLLWLRFSEGLLLAEWQPFTMIQNGPCFHAVPPLFPAARWGVEADLTPPDGQAGFRARKSTRSPTVNVISLKPIVCSLVRNEAGSTGR